MHMIQSVIFDVGGVVCSFDWHRFFMFLSEHSYVSTEKLEATLRASGCIESFERGLMTPNQFYAAVCSESRAHISKTQFKKEFTVFTARKEIYPVLTALSREVPLGLLSNTNLLHTEYIIDKLPCRKLFPIVNFSYLTGYLKPEPASYQLCLESLSCEPEDALFVDDNPENIAGAVALGMKTILFSSVHGLVTELKRYDLLTTGLSRKSTFLLRHA